MQSVSAAFTAEETDSVRRPAHSLLMSWKKFDLTNNVTFTIGMSSIGGGDVIGAIPGGVGSPGQWQYVDDSEYVMSMDWERQLNIPLGGLTKAYSEVELDNTSGRYLPDYMGGSSELFTSILPKRPQIISAGFEVDGVDETLPKFAGLLNKQPRISTRNRTAIIEADDYLGFFENKFVDNTAMFTAVTSDVLIEDIFSQAGMTTSQYELDTGLNEIPFTIIESGSEFSDVLNDLAVSENGHIFQDEEGVFRFWNNQHFFSSPYTDVQKVIHTAQVIEAESPNEDHIINVINIEADIWQKRATQQIFELSGSIEILANQDTEVFVNLEDPVLQVTSQTFTGNTQEDGTGSSIPINIKSRDVFSKAIKYVVNSTATGFITELTVNGRSAVVGETLSLRTQDDSSVTAFQERPLNINNPFIQNRTWANSLSNVLLNRFSEPDNIQKITIRALPELQLGDLVSWRGLPWRLYAIKAGYSPASGFIQELLLLKPNLDSYFKIGISTIGGIDKIAP